MVGELHAHEREVVFHGEVSPKRIVDLPAPVPVRAGDEHDERPSGLETFRDPESKRRFVVVHARRHLDVVRVRGGGRHRQ